MLLLICLKMWPRYHWWSPRMRLAHLLIQKASPVIHTTLLLLRSSFSIPQLLRYGVCSTCFRCSVSYRSEHYLTAFTCHELKVRGTGSWLSLRSIIGNPCRIEDFQLFSWQTVLELRKVMMIHRWSFSPGSSGSTGVILLVLVMAGRRLVCTTVWVPSLTGFCGYRVGKVATCQWQLFQKAEGIHSILAVLSRWGISFGQEISGLCWSHMVFVAPECRSGIVSGFFFFGTLRIGR